MSLPAIGVVIPCYKAEHTLRQTVESVLQGAPDNLQLVLVEDGSPDGTGALCNALAAQDPRVTALHQPNGGASAARNAGLDTLCRSGAEWVLFVDADDTLLPGLWQALPAAFDAQPGLILYGMVRASGALEALPVFLSPLLNKTVFPAEVLPLALLRPFSGSGALAYYEELCQTLLPDSYPARVASVLMGGSETTFYTIAVYYGAVGIKKTQNTAFAALCADFAAAVLSAVTVWFMFGKS